MATRSRIGIVNSDGSVSHIYCHWDGYLEHNGKILYEHYQDEEKVKELIKLGKLSALGKTIAECISNHKDYGYKLEISKSNSLDEMMESIDDLFIEFIYIYKEGQWFYNSCDDKEFKPLKKGLEMLNKD